MVAVLDGMDVDSSTAWEIEYAHAQGLPVYGLRTHFRTLGIEGAVNLMIERSVVMCMEPGFVDWGAAGGCRGDNFEHFKRMGGVT